MMEVEKRRLDGKDEDILRRASHVMLKILAFHLKAVRSHLSREEI